MKAESLIDKMSQKIDWTQTKSKKWLNAHKKDAILMQ